MSCLWMHWSQVAPLAAALLLAALVAEPAAAQGFPQPQQAPQVMGVQGTATIEAIAQGVIKISADGGAWLIKPDPRCKFQVLGTAEPDFLRPGQFVRFSAEFDKRGRTLTEVSEIEVFVPREGYPLGLFPDSIDGFAPDGSSAGKGPMRLKVAGKLLTLKADGEFTVSTGGRTIRAELVAQPTVKVDLVDYTLAAPGDELEFEGYFQREGAAYATEMTVKLKKTLEGPKKKTPAPR
jgi:hypothetical protein